MPRRDRVHHVYIPTGSRAYLPKGVRPRVPPLPAFTVITDRDDGTEWVLSHATDGSGTLRISLNDQGLARGPLREHTDVHRYGPFDGPVLARGVRLFVRGGRLGYEMVEYRTFSPTPYTRKGVSREVHRILIPQNWARFPDRLGWDDENELA